MAAKKYGIAVNIHFGAVPRHAEIKKNTARGICKDLGIDPRKVPN